MPKNKLLIGIIILIFLLLPGCWDRREVDLITFPLALGIDKNPAGAGYKIYAQISETKTSGQGGTMQIEYKVLESEGNTVTEAFVNMAAQVQQNISWQHVKAVVVSEQLARSGLKEAYEALGRSEAIRLNIFALITESNIKEMLMVLPTAQISLSTPLQGVEIIKQRTSEVAAISLRDFFRQMFTLGSNPVQGKVELVSQGKSKDLKFAGCAAFKKDKMVGWLDTQQTFAWTEISDKVGNSTIVTPCPGDSDKKLSFFPLVSTSYITSVISDDQIKIKVKIKLEANLSEESCPISINPETIKQMEKAVNQVEKKIVTETITKAQKEFQSDIFGFGEKVRRQDRQYWQKHKNEWDHIFVDLPVEVSIESKIRRSGKSSESITFPKETSR